jgi:hypothetical protein
MARSRAKPQGSRSALSSFDVLREQAALIETQKRRLSRLLAMEDDSHDHTPEVRHNIELLMRMCGAHLRVQQELGLEAAYLRGRRTKAEPSHSVCRHPIYTFLAPDEARCLLDLEEQVDRGEIDILELYERAGPLFNFEQKRTARSKEEDDDER